MKPKQHATLDKMPGPEKIFRNGTFPSIGTF
jgi:hypothetical protein